MKIADLRTGYKRETLDEADLAADPLVPFHLWFGEARKAEVSEPNAMTLATVAADGRPAARIVLLKDVTGGGFTCYTSSESRKGRQPAANPRAVPEAGLAATVATYLDHEETVPRPSHWGGYRGAPEAFEFWQGRRSRLHDRIRPARRRLAHRPAGAVNAR